jgi:uncharacterized protein
MKLKKINLNSIKELKPYSTQLPMRLCEYSLGEKLMWSPFYQTKYVLINNTLIMIENYIDSKYCFYYPIGDDIDGAFEIIKSYAYVHNIPLEFTCIDDEHLLDMKKRFPHMEHYYARDWSDYLYDINYLASFEGKAYQEQRNHVNKFDKLYPNAILKVGTKDDIGKILEIYKALDKERDYENYEADYEYNMSKELLKHFEEANCTLLYLENDNKPIGFAICEIIFDTLCVHVEKCLREYNGIYPKIVKEVAKYFINQVKYENREDDSGIPGLRTSKLRYRPIKIMNKYFIKEICRVDLINTLPTLKGKKVFLSQIEEKDKDAYFSLVSDDELNKYWGYDYKDDAKNNEAIDSDFIYSVVKKDFKEKTCLSYIIKDYEKKALIGEVQIYNFTCSQEAEIGVRLFKTYWHQGFANEALKLVIEYLKTELNIKIIKLKCYKENTSSEKLIKRAGAIEIAYDEKFKYFSLIA